MNPLVIKLGGVILDNKQALEDLFAVISTYKAQQHRPLIIVHGGGCLVDDLMNRLALPVVRRNGLRVTPSDQIDVIVGALSGSANKALLAQAYKHHLLGIGISLADGNSVTVKQLSPELGCVGDATAGDPTLLNLLLSQEYLPIISSIGITAEGHLMNVNADHAAVAIAKTVNADLVLLADVDGVLDENNQRIDVLTYEQANKLIDQGVIRGGMVVKVQSVFEAATMLGKPIHITSWKESNQLIDLFNGKSIGTTLKV
ncbi:N-acetylglutamate kinase [Frischella perrara]|uniref:Acetylglutamate kinase n=1 Tax=Frischella perrara TaxID=1267021 RepID=A0A0A7S8E7_FRIPE|nr:acetylglutamate kinase [Frischella perrara]AJA45546.1 N-acetylglutamate kinase [Frischella perrara]PWV59906.1 N-acetylglutamate kinase [Frischella perrara]